MNAYIVTFIFVVVDYITGLCKAGATHSFSSKIMREGLWRKLALLMAMVVGYLADFAQGLIDLGLKAPVGAAICVYICLMELVSAIENICAMNPDLVPEKLLAMFGRQVREGQGNEQD
jgi:toxin secretion/phage lysis holin